jgi:DNA-binding PadR family transcriptional regulator
VTDTNREAKFYRLTAAGQKELQKAEKSFEQLIKGIRAVLRYA